MTTITFDTEFPGGVDLSHALVKVELDTGGLGPGFVGGVEIAGVHKFHLDENGEGAISLPGNDDIEPAGSVWEIDVEDYRVRLTVPVAGTYSWGDPDIQAPPGPAPVRYTPPHLITPDAYGIDVPGGLLSYEGGQLASGRAVDLRQFGTLTAGAEDWASAPDVTALLTLAQAQLEYGDRLVLPRGYYTTEPVTFDTPLRISGQGKFLTRLGPADGSTGDALITLENTSTWVQAGHTDGWLIEDLTLDGRGRTFDMHGMVWIRGNRSTMRGVRIAHFARSGLVLNDSVRESHFYDLWLRHCGDGQTYPQLDISYTGDADGTNNLFFVMLNTAYPHGDNVWIRPHSDVDDHGGVRSVFFDHCLFHGVTQAPGASLSASDGNAYTSTPDMRNGLQFWHAGASSVWVSHSRFIAAAWGQPAVRVSGFYDDGSVPSGGCQLRMTGIHAGGSSSVLTGTFTVDTGTNIATTADHFLSTGARVTVTTDGTLPAPLAAGTDYFVVVDTSGTFHLAPTWRDAHDDTNTIDLTTTGTGTHTWTVSRHDFHIAAEATGALLSVSESKLDGTVDNGSVRVDNPSAARVLIGPGTTAGSSQPPLQGGMSANLGEWWAYLRSASTKNNDATPALEPDLVLNQVRRNGVYALEGYFVASGSETADFQFGFDIPNLATIEFLTEGLPSGATSASAQTNYSVTTGDLTMRTVGTLVGGSAFRVTGKVVTGNTTGDVGFHWAQAVADASDTALSSGWVRLTRMY